jgi:hypothetical protein
MKVKAFSNIQFAISVVPMNVLIQTAKKKTRNPLTHQLLANGVR